MAARSVGLSVISVDVRTSCSRSRFCRFRSIRWWCARVVARSSRVFFRIATSRATNAANTETAVRRVLNRTSLVPRLAERQVDRRPRALATVRRLRQRDPEVQDGGLSRLDPHLQDLRAGPLVPAHGPVVAGRDAVDLKAA